MNDKVECSVCGKKYKVITSSHLRKHDISIEDYKLNYPDSPLSSQYFVEKMKVINRNINGREDVRKKISDSVKEANKADNLRKRKSDGMKKVWDSKDYRDRMYTIHVEAQNRDEVKTKKSNSLKDTWKTDVFRDKMQSIYKSEEYQEKVIAIQKEVSSRPEIVKNKKIKSRALWDSKEFRVRVAKGRKRFKYSINGLIVYLRSSWEKKVCEYLDTLKIPYEYESTAFKYMINNEERLYIPDIYLETMNVYLEIKPEYFARKMINIIKLEAVRKTGNRIEFLTGEHIEDIEIFENFLNALR